MWSNVSRTAALSLRSVARPTRRMVVSPVATTVQRRFLNFHEYQSKDLMNAHEVDVQRFRVAETAEDAERLAKELNAEEIVIKAQVHAGGRGKGVFSNGFKGGVHLTKDHAKVGEIAGQMLGHNLVTKQTPPGGVEVKKVMVAEALDISKETYFAILLDRAVGGPVLVGSPEGGMDIEAVAERSPEKIYKLPVSLENGPTTEEAETFAAQLGFEGPQIQKAATQIKNMYSLFKNLDLTQLEINPFGETPQGRVVAFDAKLNFDENASFRHPDLVALRDTAEEDPREVEASKHDLNYVGMDGNIGCLVNGAGLAMATMDIIKLNGAEPANFLDVGGSATADQVKEAFKILTSDSQVKAILVNIFGGIMKCDIIAEGIVAAAKDIGLNLPLVVRLSGTNVDIGKKILEDSGLPIVTADDLDDAAAKSVAAIS